MQVNYQQLETPSPKDWLRRLNRVLIPMALFAVIIAIRSDVVVPMLRRLLGIY